MQGSDSGFAIKGICVFDYFLNKWNEKQLRIVCNIKNTDYLSNIKACPYNQLTALWVKTEKSYAPLEMTNLCQNQRVFYKVKHKIVIIDNIPKNKLNVYCYLLYSYKISA